MKAKNLSIGIVIEGDAGVIDAALEGYAYVEAGFLYGEIRGVQRSLTLRENVLASAFTFTGCPIAARTDRPDLNPWLITQGSYVGRRALTLGGARVKSILRAEGNVDSVRMQLRISVHGDIPPLVGIARPFQERIEGTGPGTLSGQFSLCFELEDGRTVDGMASTAYELPADCSSSESWRNITIEGTPSRGSYRQVEQIDMYGDVSYARVDLEQRLLVCAKANGASD